MKYTHLPLWQQQLKIRMIIYNREIEFEEMMKYYNNRIHQAFGCAIPEKSTIYQIVVWEKKCNRLK